MKITIDTRDPKQVDEAMAYFAWLTNATLGAPPKTQEAEKPKPPAPDTPAPEPEVISENTLAAVKTLTADEALPLVQGYCQAKGQEGLQKAQGYFTSIGKGNIQDLNSKEIAALLNHLGIEV